MDQQTGEQQGGRPEERPVELPGSNGLSNGSGAGAAGRTPGAAARPAPGGTEGFDGSEGLSAFDAFGAARPIDSEHAFGEEPALGDELDVFGGGVAGGVVGGSAGPGSAAGGFESGDTAPGAPGRSGELERRDSSERRERVGRFEAVGSFDAFAAGAKRPAGSGSGSGSGSEPAESRPALPPADPGPGNELVVRSFGEPMPLQQGTSLFDGTMPLPKVTRPTRDPLAPELGTSGGATSRVPKVVTPEYLLTVNPVDGTEVVPCPPDERRTPVRRTPEDRAARINAGRPTPPPGPPAPEVPLLEREEERERLIRLLARGRSTRVTGPSGAGRTALLESVANACADLAPDGVIRLSGYHRTAADLLHDLYTIVYAGEGYRPGRAELPGLLREVGAVVVLDDLEIGGAALEELLDAAPECAFLMSATPDVPAPAADSMVEEVLLSGLTRVACVDLLQLVTGRRLEEDETAWAADLWFESEGLPLRFVQAGALLRQRDAMRTPPDPDLDDSVWLNGSALLSPAEPPLPDLTGFDGPESGAAAPEIPPPPPLPLRLPVDDVPLPSLAESAAPADLLASRLSEAAREALAFAVALDGECPHPSHLPALVGDTHGDAALGELISVGLAVPVASHFRLAAGVVQQLGPALAADGELNDVQAHTAALHYAWWTGHPSVTPERATAESEAILAAMTACRDGGHASAAVLLARTVSPVFAAALHWGAWERALRIGQEAARLSGEVAEEAYFHHELGVLALCTGGMDRARAELEASIALRGALADRQGTVVGRRTLALVNDRVGTYTPELPPGALESAFPQPDTATVVLSKVPPALGPGAPSVRRLAVIGSRRNLVAAGTGVLLAAVLGTFVTLGATSSGDGAPTQTKPIETVEQDAPSDTSPSSVDATHAAPAASTTSASTSASTTVTPSSPAGGDTTTPSAPTTTPSEGTTSPPGVPITLPPGGPSSHPASPTPTKTTHSPAPTSTKPSATPTSTSPSPTGSTTPPPSSTTTPGQAPDSAPIVSPTLTPDGTPPTT
ncbi:ATP-binding protein [Streptomyces polygonati]|uniref:ATP-binding protein n=1 Tax=Streptomyces polygonati TaxID=1617087 RepID=A0ABV8HIZ7_9ACTN